MSRLITSLLYLLVLSVGQAFSQSDSLAGEYHLQGVMETASALILKPDSTFEIYFSYGAMDRQGSGIWQVDQGKIILNSRPRPKVDYALVSAKTTSEDFTTIKILSQNRLILPHFEVMVRSGSGQNYGKTDTEGVYTIPKTTVTAIELFFTFCPERFSTFPVKSGNNYFEFKLESWIAEIFAENIALYATPGGLTGQHPLLSGDAFKYIKKN
jgi:hypothetical protein